MSFGIKKISTDENDKYELKENMECGNEEVCSTYQQTTHDTGQSATSRERRNR